MSPFMQCVIGVAISAIFSLFCGVLYKLLGKVLMWLLEKYCDWRFGT